MPLRNHRKSLLMTITLNFKCVTPAEETLTGYFFTKKVKVIFTKEKK